MAQIMPEKRRFPLNNPPSEKRAATAAYPCPFCKWVGKSSVALSYHVNVYHEAVVAAEGDKSLREGGDKWHGDYIGVDWLYQDWPTQTPEQWRKGKETVCRLFLLLHPGETESRV